MARNSTASDRYRLLADAKDCASRGDATGTLDNLAAVAKQGEAPSAEALRVILTAHARSTEES